MGTFDDELKALREETEVYTKLKELAKTEGFEHYLEFLVRSTSAQLLGVFIGPSAPKTWEDFILIRGEILAKLLILQELGGAEKIVEHLNNQIKQYIDPPEL